jgi:predicted RNase H-like nuclease
VSEAHPESSFAEMARRPLPSRKNTAAGRVDRIELLRPSFPDVELCVAAQSAFAVDVLDAFAAAWTARRIALGAARWFGDDERDERGLSMRVAV